MKRTKAFAAGLRDGIPIGLGYLAVAFSLGIAARNAGIDAVQGFVMSWLGMASAGEYAAITVIAAATSPMIRPVCCEMNDTVFHSFPYVPSVR